MKFRVAAIFLVVSTVAIAAMADERWEHKRPVNEQHHKAKHATAVPEPANLLLIGAGVLGLWAAKSRKYVHAS